MSTFPIIGVAQNEKVPGANTLNDIVPALTCLPLDEALTREWPTDAHMVCYSAVNQQSWPRCNKPLLGHFRALGGDLLSTIICIDIDLPGHARNKGSTHWTTDLYKEFCSTLLTYPDALCTNWTAFYTTRAGVRFVYALDNPIPVDQVEPYIRGIYSVFELMTKPLNYEIEQLAGWNHIFRLPRVARDGLPTSQFPYFECIIQPDKRLDLGTIVTPKFRPILNELGLGTIHVLEIPMPDPSAAMDLLREPDAGGAMRITAWMKAAKKRLAGRECYSSIFEGADIAPEGRRHTTIFAYVGTACRMLYNLDGTSPELVFALFCEAGFRINPVTCRRPPHETIWQAVLHCWAREEARAEQENKKLLIKEAGRRSAQSVILEGARTWCDAPEIHQSDESAIRWLDGHLIACRGEMRFLMRPDGFYDSVGVTTNLLPARIRELGMESVMPLTQINPRTGLVGEIQPNTLVNRHGTVVSAVEGVVESKGAIVHSLGTDQARLELRLFGLRTDLTPTYDAEIDEWLNAFGGDAYHRLCDWLGHALDFTSPICALSIVGPQGIGKGLLIQGLSECVDTQVYADGNEFGVHQSLLKRSPFLVVNEGFPHSVPGGRDVADTFRALVDGSAIVINEKFQPPMTIRNPVRIIIAANNDDVVASLCGSKNLSTADRDALALRLLHIDASDAAQKFLENLGGYMHTGKPGRRWVRGPHGVPSDHILAGHLMWLHKHKCPVPKGNRFLVEGDLTAEILRKFSTGTGCGPEVIEAVVGLIEANAPVEGLHIENESQIFVSPYGVLHQHRLLGGSARTKQHLSFAGIAKILELVRVPGTVKTSRTFGPEGSKSARWREIDPILLLNDAIDYGLRCEKLKVLAQNAQVLRIESM